MRVLRERDEMQGVLEKYERHLSEIQANVKVLTADRDKTSMYHQQVNSLLAALSLSSLSVWVKHSTE